MNKFKTIFLAVLLGCSAGSAVSAMPSTGAQSTLYVAVTSNNVQEVKQILDSFYCLELRSALIAAKYKNGCTALHWAAIINNLEIAQLLITSIDPKLKSDLISAKDNNSMTALDIARKNSSKQMIQLLS